MTPFCAEGVFGCEDHGEEKADGAFGVGSLGFCWWGSRGFVGAGEEGADEISNRGFDCREELVALPEAVVGGRVAEDEHEADDDRETRDGCRWDAQVSFSDAVYIAHCGGEECVQADRYGNVEMYRAFDEA